MKKYDDELEEGFEDLGDTSELDNLLLSEGGDEDLVEKMNDQQEKSVVEKTPWMQDFREHWYWYLILGLSFLLTEMTAIYLGLAPYLTTNPETGLQEIYWNNDLGHLATALVYMLLFPAVTELAFDRAWKKYSKREPGNFAQAVTMIIAIVASSIAILGTGVAGFYVVFSTLGSIGFLEIPRNVQLWLIFIVPFLLALFGILHGIYKVKSKMEKLNRLVDHKIQTAELSDRLRNKMTEQKARRAIRSVARRSYIRAVASGLLSQQEADDAIAKGKSLVQLEKELNRDLTGEGKIGEGSMPPRLSAPGQEPSYHPVDLTRNTTPWDCVQCGTANPSRALFCSSCGASAASNFAQRSPTREPKSDNVGHWDGSFSETKPAPAGARGPYTSPGPQHDNGNFH